MDLVSFPKRGILLSPVGEAYILELGGNKRGSSIWRSRESSSFGADFYFNPPFSFGHLTCPGLCMVSRSQFQLLQRANCNLPPRAGEAVGSGLAKTSELPGGMSLVSLL